MEKNQKAKNWVSGRRDLFYYVLTTVFLAGCLILPGNVLQAWDARQQETVLEADKEYYSRQIAAYTGELDLYRKLLMVRQIWKSERTLVAEQNLWQSGTWEDQGDSQEEIPADSAAVLLQDVANHLFQPMGQLEAWHYQADAKLRMYEYQDSVLGKYRFFLGEAQIVLSNLGTMEETEIRLICDPETYTILAVRVGKPLEEIFLETNGMESVSQYMRVYFDTGIESHFPDSLSKALRATEQKVLEPGFWEQPEDLTIYEQYHCPWAENADQERIMMVVQDDSQCFQMFLRPEE